MKIRKRSGRWSDNESGRELLVKILARAIHRSITDEKKLEKSDFLKGTRPSADEKCGV